MKAITLAGLGPNERMFALQEASVLAQMSHPNIIRYTDTFIARERLYIVMEYAEAGDLWRIMYKNPDGIEVWPEEIVLGFFLQMCLAVKFVHDRSILHRDIKPANCFLTKGGILKLGDFGIARVLERNQMARTQVGTPFYVAPEICHKLSYGKKADVWALGCVLFEMCAKEPPFNGRSISEIQRKITSAPVPANPRLIHKYSPEMRKLVAQTLHKRPNQRPSVHKMLQSPTLQEKADSCLLQLKEFVHQYLDRARSGVHTTPKRPPPPVPKLVPAAAAPSKPEPAPPPKPPPKRVSPRPAMIQVPETRGGPVPIAYESIMPLSAQGEMDPKMDPAAAAVAARDSEAAFDAMRISARISIQDAVATPIKRDPDMERIEAEYDALLGEAPGQAEAREAVVAAGPRSPSQGVDDLLAEAETLGVGLMSPAGKGLAPSSPAARIRQHKAKAGLLNSANSAYCGGEEKENLAQGLHPVPFPCGLVKQVDLDEMEREISGYEAEAAAPPAPSSPAQRIKADRDGRAPAAVSRAGRAKI